jgi:hypothetical protein
MYIIAMVNHGASLSIILMDDTRNLLPIILAWKSCELLINTSGTQFKVPALSVVAYLENSAIYFEECKATRVVAQGLCLTVRS